MITFITDENLYKSAQNLDDRRLVNQLRECRFMLDLLVNKFLSRWTNTPMVEQWRGHEGHLWDYAYYVNMAIGARGLETKQTIKDYTSVVEIMSGRKVDFAAADWWTDKDTRDRIIRSHRRRLYEKNPSHYSSWVNYRFDPLARPCCYRTTGRCNYVHPTHLLTKPQ